MGTKIHFNILDNLRGIASVLVCLFHFTNGHLPKLTNGVSSTIFLEGGVGVYIFFVISGFVIPYVMYKVNYHISIKEFYGFILKRFIRIWPVSAISILILVVFWQIIDFFLSSSYTYMSLFSMEGLVSNLLYVAPFFNCKWFNGVLWTLSVEFQYYIFIGLFYNLILKNQKSLIVSTLIFSIPLFLNPPIGEFPDESVFRNIFFVYYPFFALGFITLHFKLGKISKVIFYAIVTFIGIFSVFQFNNIIAFSSVTTSLAIVYADFKNNVLIFLGKVSYSLYLTHMISGAAFEGIVTKIINANSDVIKCVLQFFTLLFSVGCAFIFFVLIERPFMNLSNSIIRRNNH